MTEKWVKKEGCNCSKCLDVENKIECKKDYYENKWNKKEKCSCSKCYEAENNKQDTEKKCNCYEKECKSDCNKYNVSHNKIEFQYDESHFNQQQILLEPLEILQVSFDKVCLGDKVWLSGIVGFDNNNSYKAATLKITITRTEKNGLPKQIYFQAFEIDKKGNDDLTQISFSDIDVVTSELCDVIYSVRVQLVSLNVCGFVLLEGQSTLTALKFC